MHGLLSVIQAAKYLDYHPQTLRDLARRGKIPAIKRRQKWFFDRKTLDKWVIANEAVGGIKSKEQCQELLSG